MKNISLLFTALLFFSSAQAQFGDLLNKFKSEVDKTQSARPAPAPAPASTSQLKIGTYKSDFGVLDVGKVNVTSFTFDLNVTVGMNAGEVSGTANGRTGKYIYENKTQDCKLTFEITKEILNVSQDGDCQFGMGVNADGVYKLQSEADKTQSARPAQNQTTNTNSNSTQSQPASSSPTTNDSSFQFSLGGKANPQSKPVELVEYDFFEHREAGMFWAAVCKIQSQKGCAPNSQVILFAFGSQDKKIEERARGLIDKNAKVTVKAFMDSKGNIDESKVITISSSNLSMAKEDVDALPKISFLQTKEDAGAGCSYWLKSDKSKSPNLIASDLSGDLRFNINGNDSKPKPYKNDPVKGLWQAKLGGYELILIQRAVVRRGPESITHNYDLNIVKDSRVVNKIDLIGQCGS
jgi:hypothetical protein